MVMVYKVKVWEGARKIGPRRKRRARKRVAADPFPTDGDGVLEPPAKRPRGRLSKEPLRTELNYDPMPGTDHLTA